MQLANPRFVNHVLKIEGPAYGL